MKLLLLFLLIPFTLLAPGKKKPMKGKAKADHTFSLPTPDNIMEYISECDIKYPEVAWRQIILETGRLSSIVFRENNNLFGMREPYRRETTAIGSNRYHAVYRNWKESVEDYKLWQVYMDSIGWIDLSSKEAYYNSLDILYATAANYSKTLKQLR